MLQILLLHWDSFLGDDVDHVVNVSVLIDHEVPIPSERLADLRPGSTIAAHLLPLLQSTELLLYDVLIIFRVHIILLMLSWTISVIIDLELLVISHA